MSRSDEKQQCTRYGPISTPVAKMGHEKRFAWQKLASSTDGMYDLPDVRSSRAVTFGSSVRMGEQNSADAIKRSTGPGSYEFAHCYDKMSEFKKQQGSRFALAPRESLDLKTPSPGAVYDITKQYWNGPEKGIKIGFNCDKRPPLCNPSYTANADMLYPKLPKGRSISIGSRHKTRKPGRGPGLIYNITESMMGPSYSFGRGHSGRFKKVAFLPEIDD